MGEGGRVQQIIQKIILDKRQYCIIDNTVQQIILYKRQYSMHIDNTVQQIILYNRQYSMHIDSPQFVRRKVLVSKGSGEYNYGDQRAMLARFVADNLHSSDHNAQILERFRREAQQYKHNLRKKKHPLPHPQPPMLPNHSQPPPIIIPQHSIESDTVHLSQLLRKQQFEITYKDREIRRRDRLLAKNRREMREMAKKIEAFQQQLELNRIEGMLGSISNQIKQGRKKIILRNLNQNHQRQERHRDSMPFMDKMLIPSLSKRVEEDVTPPYTYQERGKKTQRNYTSQERENKSHLISKNRKYVLKIEKNQYNKEPIIQYASQSPNFLKKSKVEKIKMYV